MRLLKIFLWMILLSCIVWGGLIFAGPHLIAWSVERYTGGEVVMKRLEVSPRLQVSARQIDVKSQSGQSAGKAIKIRGANIGWRYDAGLVITATAGSASASNIGDVKTVEMTLRPTSLFDWNETNFTLSLVDLRGRGNHIEWIEMIGSLEEGFEEVADLEIRFRGFQAVSPQYKKILADNLTLLMDRAPLTQNTNRQAINFTINAPSGLIVGDIKVKSANALGTLLGSVINSAVNLDTISDATDAIKINKMKLRIDHDFGLQTKSMKINFSMRDLSYQKISLIANEVDGELQLGPDTIATTLRSQLEGISISRDNVFIAEISNADFVADFEVSSRGDTGVNVASRATLSTLDKRDITADITATLPRATLPGCIRGACNQEDFSADINIRTQAAKISGNAKCDQNLCGYSNLQYEFQTDDTNRLFQDLMELKFFNPLLLTSALVALSNGTATGSGHVIRN